MENEILDYLIDHADEITKQINSLANETKTNPILESFYKEAVLSEVCLIVAEGMGLSYEEVSCVIDKPLIIKVLGDLFVL